MNIKLPTVTLCALDTANVELTIRAMKLCRNVCDFGDAVLITDKIVKESGIRVESIPSFENREIGWNFGFKHLHKFINTDFVLLVQWDGYILDAKAWNNDFLIYDYIGATWPQHMVNSVGNGGFNLRSTKLMKLLANEFDAPLSVPEDEYICRTLRPELEMKHFIKFPPTDIANAFSYERSALDKPTFGFHGLFNMWRHVDDTDMVWMTRKFSNYLITRREYAELMIAYYVLRKFNPFRALLERLREHVDDVNHHLVSTLKLAPEVVDNIIATCG